ncbi:MAG: phage portal protein [Alphaproteobacteria bacterium 65-7]|nr:MAG: phage portal protein [Alphaproteobacteria bacterium 65-7]
MFDFFRKAPPETKGGVPLIALSLQGRTRWSGRDTASLARMGVMTNTIAYACVRKIAGAAASVPWLLYDGDRELDSHPLLTLLARPNGMEDGAGLFERWHAFLQTAGNAYLECVTLDGAPRELHVLRPDRVQVVAGPRGWPVAYDYVVDGQATRIGRDASGFLPVLHTALFHPLDDYYGLSPLEVAGAAIEVHNAGAAWTKALLDNAARPSGALIYKGVEGSGLSEEQFGRLKRELEDAYQGSANAGRPMVLEGGLDWKAMSHAPADLDFADSRAMAAREIALAFGVPPMLLGIPGDNTYSNYAEANQTFWRQAVLPLVARTAAALTRWLAPRFGDGLRIGFDTDAVEALAAQRESLWAKLDGASFLTVDEKRAAAGYSPLEDGGRV